MRLILVIATLVLGQSVALVSAAGQRAQSGRVDSARRTEQLLTRWSEDLDKVHEAVLEAEWRPAERRLDRIERDLVTKALDGPDIPPLLARISFLRALIEAGGGDYDAASWNDAVARYFVPELANVDVNRYGPAGAALTDLRRGGEVPEGDEESAPVDGILPPRRLKSSPPAVFPLPHRILCHEDVVEVRAILTTSGHLARPRIVSPVEPTLAFAALRIMSSWRFVPAELEGKPIPTWFTGKINFRIAGNCDAS